MRYTVQTNKFLAFTTVVVDVESNDDTILSGIQEILDRLGYTAKSKSHRYVQVVENHYDEDIVKVWRFVVLSNQDDGTIQAEIGDIADLF